MPARKPLPALIDQLVEGASPVRRPWPPVVRLTWWLLLLAASAGLVVLRQGVPFGDGIRSPALAFEVGTAAVVAALWCALALRAAVPGLEPTRRALTLVAALSPLPLVFWLAGQPARTDTTLAAFTASGVPCALATVAFALLLLAPLLWAQGRAAPLEARRSAWLSGAAGFAGGYVLMRFFCSVDDPAHLLAWHVLPLPLGTAAAAAASTWLLARWRR